MSLDEFYRHLSTTDTKKKLSVGVEIIAYLEDVNNSIDCEDTGAFIDGLVPWMQSSNFKVSQNGLDIVGLFVERLGHSFRPYLNTVLGAVQDRLGDSRESVREKSLNVIGNIMEGVVEPQALLEKMMPAFSHKNAKVREEMLCLLQNTLNSFGSHSLTVTKFLPSVINLLGDPTAPVRDAANTTLVEIYRHVGERVRQDLQKKYQVPPAKLNALIAKFDDARSSGNMMPTATLSIGTTEGNHSREDETDRNSSKSAKSRSSSVPAHERRAQGTTGFSAPRPPTSESTRSNGGPKITGVRRNQSMRMAPSATGGGSAGAMDEESFIAAFEDVKRVTIYNGRGLSDEVSKIRETLSKSSNDWKVRVDSLQMLRSLMIAGATNFDEMHNALRTLDVPFQVSVKDLRSQVVREACITIAYFSQQLSTKVDRFLESLLQPLINLIPNSAKVMSSSGIVCVRFIIQNTFSSRFLPVLTSNISSKSREIRRHCCEFLDHLLHTWPTHVLEKHVGIIGESIKKGISDADPDARQFARKAYWGFADHFKEQADILLNSLDMTYRRLLQAGEMSNSSSSNSLHRAGGVASSSKPRSRQASVTGSNENLIDHHSHHGGGYSGMRGAGSRGATPSGSATLGRKHSGSGIPLFSSPHKNASSPFNGHHSPSPGLYGGRMTPNIPPGTPTGMSVRSNSAIDPSAVRRASVRAQYAQRNGIQIAGGSHLRESSTGGMTPDPLTPGGVVPPSRRSRSGMGTGTAHSQPGSRSTSPSSLRSYQTYNFDSSPFTPNSNSSTLGRRRSSGIPRSTTSSREQSPNRGAYGGGVASPRYPRGVTPTSSRPPKKPQMTENVLKQSREAESALADALTNPRRAPPKRPPHNNNNNNNASSGPFFDDNVSDEDGSEGSSISSAGAGGANHGGPSPMKPRYLQSPNTSLPSSRNVPKYQGRTSGIEDDSENLNPEEVHKSLRSTANAIQNYSFDSPGVLSPGMLSKNDFLDGTEAGHMNTTLEEKMSLMDLSGSKRGSRNMESRSSFESSSSGKDGDESSVVINEIMETLSTVKTQSNTVERRNCMTKLIRMSRESKTALIQENFKVIFRLLLENLADEVGATRALVFGVLTEMLKQKLLIPSFQAFTELIILKVLEAHRDEEKDVERAAESCAAEMAKVLPPDLVIRVLNPLIKTGDFPVNQAAIKMLTKVADQPDNNEIIFQHLGDMMPGLLKAYDNVESSVRKASVFCMVALHQIVGDDLQPHLESLNGSKLKLLNLYIKRAQAQKEQSAPVSPRQLATPL